MIPAGTLRFGTTSLVDVEAQRMLLRDLHTRGYRMALLDLRDSALAWDVVQETSEALLRHYAQHPVAELVPLFYSILRNRIRDQQRRFRLEKFLGPWRDQAEGMESDLEGAVDPSAGPEAQASGQELGAHIEWALAQLPVRQREAFLLREWEQLSVEETALAMACSPGSVKVHHFRALRKLRSLLADRFEEGL